MHLLQAVLKAMSKATQEMQRDIASLEASKQEVIISMLLHVGDHTSIDFPEGSLDQHLRAGIYKHLWQCYLCRSSKVRKPPSSLMGTEGK